MASPQGFWCWTWIAASTVDALAQEAAAAKRALEDPELADTQQKRKAKDLEKEEEKGEEKRDKMEVASGSSGALETWGKWQDEQRWKPEASRSEGKAAGKTRRPLPLPKSASAPALGCAKWPRCWTEAVALRGLMQHASIKSTCKQTYTTSYHTHTHIHAHIHSRITHWARTVAQMPRGPAVLLERGW